MKRSGRENRKALAWTLVGMVLCALLLETRGLLAWAERLEVGSLRPVAREASARLASVTEQTRIPAARTALLELVAANKREDKAPAQIQPTATKQASVAPAQPAPAAMEDNKPAPAVNTGPVVAAIPTAPKPTLTENRGSGFTVILVGDSMMAVGLGPYLTRQLSSTPQVRVVRAYRSGTGLSRPEVFNWHEQYPKMVGNTHADLIICAIGANDAQNFMLNGKPVAFGSAEWVEEYQRRVTSLVDEVAPDETPVLWLALPSMRSEKYARHVSQLNAVVREKLSQRSSVTWLEANPLLGGGASTYVEFQKNSRQKLERLRQADGIHLSDAGAERVGQAVVAWVMQHLDRPQSAQGSAISADL